MALSIVIKPLAELDIENAVQWHEEQKVKLGEEFLFELRDAIRVVALTPFGFRKRLKSIRSFALKRFPYTVYYIFKDETLFVIAVLHQKRNPKLWKKRK
jgi:toxin ParE1/3/4